MHPFPSTADLQFLVGEEIGQICLDPYGLQFRFVNGGQISVQGRIEHIDKDGKPHPHDCQAQPKTALYLHQLLQRRIVKVEAQPYRLSLTFNDGAVLYIFSDDGLYECGQIHTRSGSMDVF